MYSSRITRIESKGDFCSISMTTDATSSANSNQYRITLKFLDQSAEGLAWQGGNYPDSTNRIAFTVIGDLEIREFLAGLGEVERLLPTLVN